MVSFGTAGIRGDVHETVTPQVALSVGRAVATEEAIESVVIGRDGRTTGTALVDATAAGLVSGGVDVTRIGCVPTPTLAFASQGRHGIMLTASHNPPGDNGLKLFDDGVEYDRTAEERIEERIVGSDSPVHWDEWGAETSGDVLSSYRQAVVSFAKEHGSPLEGIRVAVDCGNGVAGLATPQVLNALGGSVTALNANVDGHFPARDSKPTPESLAEFRAFVADGDVSVGIAHDGDADRIAIVDTYGDIVHEDTILAILAHHYVSTSNAGEPVVVTTPNASARIDDRVTAAGGRVERTALGALHEGVDRVESTGETVVFAAEPWKHIHPSLGGWIDAVASAALLGRLIAESGDLDTLREPVTERPYEKTNVACQDNHKAAAMAQLAQELPEHFPDAAVDTAHGVRIALPDDSWVLVRPSGTEPYIRIYAESEEIQRLVDTVIGIVEDVVSAVNTPTSDGE